MVRFGTDAVVIYLCAREPSLFWLYPLLTTAGSIAGAAVTYAIGVKVGDKGLTKFVSARQLDRLRGRIKEVGALTLGFTAAMPPPFPLTAFVLTSGALEVGRARFFTVFAVARLIRFGVEGVLARRYGTAVLRMLESPTAHAIAIGLVIISILGTAITIVQVSRSTRRGKVAGSA